MNLDTTLWLAYNVVEAVAIGLMLYRRLWRAFPVFFSYIVWELTANIWGYIVLHLYPSSYFTAFLAVTIVDSILLFCVVVELAWSILKPVQASLSRKALFVIAGLILVVAAAVWPFAALSGASGEKHLLVQLQQTVSIVQVIFFLLLIAGSQLLSIGFRDRELQVATGLGFFSFVNLATAFLRMHQNSYVQYRHAYQIALCSYICTLLYWIVSFAQKEAKRREFTPQMQRALLAMAGATRAARIAVTESRAEKAQKHDGRRF